MKLDRTVALAALVLGACTSEKISYVTRPFNAPPDATAGFLGYFTVNDKQTTCGNCHVGHQADWVTTKHANAWADLQASGHAVASCNGCHTVSERGNSTGHAAGYNAVANAAYHDVQCESCHGAGYTHVQNPEVAANRPLASIAVDTAISNGCGGCHTGVHEPFVDQWIQSAHGSGPALSHVVGNATCLPCHEGQAALSVKFGVTSNFVEKGSTTPLHIVCIVCHDPHGTAGFKGQLRASVSTPTVDNLCIKCHSRSASPPWGAASATRGAGGPHGAQGLLVIGQSAGWIPPNFTYDTSLIVSSHGTAANARLCATCHVTFTTITAANGAFQMQNVGHLFEAIPCLDANNIPVAGGTCAQAQRDFSGCLGSGCHATRISAVSAYNANVATLENLLDQIWKDVNTNGNIDSTDTGLIPQLVARALRPGATAADTAQINFGSTTTTVAKGTLYNAVLAATDTRAYFFGGTVLGKAWAAHQSSGNGVHNPFLLQALLVASIATMHSTYGLAPPAHQDLRIRATPPPGLRMSTSVSTRVSAR